MARSWRRRGAAWTTIYSYDANGNLTTVAAAGATVTMLYDKENRSVVHKSGSTLTTSTYDGDGLKRSERNSGAVTTLVRAHGADPGRKDADGKSALDVAREGGDPKVLAALKR